MQCNKLATSHAYMQLIPRIWPNFAIGLFSFVVTTGVITTFRLTEESIRSLVFSLLTLPFRIRFSQFFRRLKLVSIAIVNMPPRPLVLSSSLRVAAVEVTNNIVFLRTLVATESRRQAVVDRQAAPHVGPHYLKATVASAHTVAKSGEVPLSAADVALVQRFWNALGTRDNAKIVGYATPTLASARTVAKNGEVPLSAAETRRVQALWARIHDRVDAKKVGYAAPTKSSTARAAPAPAPAQPKRPVRLVTGTEKFLGATTASSHTRAKDGEVPLSPAELARVNEFWGKVRTRPNKKTTGFAAPTAASSARQLPLRPRPAAQAAAPVPAGGQ